MEITLSGGHQTEIYIETYGSGSPILFLHGGPGCCHDSFAPFFKPLMERCQVIYYDQIACGQSSQSVDWEYHLSHELEVIEQIRQNLGHERLTIVGESWGTFLGLQYASHYPHRVRDLVLLSSVGFGMEHMHLFSDRLMAKVTDADRQQLSYIEQQLQNHEVEETEALRSSQEILNPYYLFDRSRMSEIINQPINFQQHLRVVALFDEELDFMKRVENLKQVRIHMYQATNDLISNQDIATILVDKINPTSFIAVPECGHWIYLEKSEYINSEIMNIISTNLVPIEERSLNENIA